MRRTLLAGLIVLITLFGVQTAAPELARADAYPGTNGAAYVLRSTAGNGDVFSLNAADLSSSTYSPLVTSGDVNAISISPNGRRIAYAQEGVGSGIYVMDLYTRVPVRITPAGSSTYYSPTWSPAGDALAFVEFTGGGIFQLNIASADGTDLAVLSTTAQPRYVTWSPTNDYVLLYVNAFGGTIRRLDFYSGTDTSLIFQTDAAVAFAPDGLTMYFSDISDGQVYRSAPSVGATATQLTFSANGVVLVRSIAPSPDGTVFVFTYDDSFGLSAIGRATTDTGTLLQSTGTGGLTNESVTWGPAVSPGYRLVASDGGIFTFGSATFEGSTGALTLNQPIVGMASTPSGNGYWLVASDGGIFSFGDATFYGSTGAMRLNRPIVGMAPTVTGLGYWLVASDGGIFSFGDATFYGSTGALSLNRPIVGMAATPTGNGYWLVASDGGIFSFGDAAFLGSTGALTLNRPIVGMTAAPNGNGYWLVASDGGIFTFGSSTFYGSTGALTLNQPIVGMTATPTGLGYWLVASDGGIFSFGDASFQGSTGAIRLNRPIVGMAA